VTSSAVVVTAVATQLGVVSEPSATAQSGQVFGAQPSVSLRDAGGNPVSQAGVTITAEITGGGATLLGTASASTNASGVAAFTNLGISGTVGTYSLTFKSTGLTNATSSAISLTAGAAVKLIITNQPPGTVISGTTFTVAVRIADAQNNFVNSAGVSVNAVLNGTPGSLNGTNPVATNGLGSASFGDLSITGSTAGNSHTITFSATGLSSATTTEISILLFDVQASETVMEITRRDEETVLEPEPGTKPVAEDTVGLPTFTNIGVRADGIPSFSRPTPLD
jgi:hypothetical protein